MRPVLMALLLAAGCAYRPPPPDAPPPGARPWDAWSAAGLERFQLWLPGGRRLVFPQLAPVPPIGLEPGEGWVGVGVDVLGVEVKGPEERRPAPSPADPDLERIERDLLRDELRRSQERVREAVERSKEPPPPAGPDASRPRDDEARRVAGR